MPEAPEKRNKNNANCKRLLFHSPTGVTQSATPSSRSKKRARHEKLQRVKAKQPVVKLQKVAKADSLKMRPRSDTTCAETLNALSSNLTKTRNGKVRNRYLG